MTIAQKIILLRKQQGISQETLAQKLNVSRQSVSKWESGAATPSMENLSELAQLFQVTTGELIDQHIVLPHLQQPSCQEGPGPDASALQKEVVLDKKRKGKLLPILLVTLGITNLLLINKIIQNQNQMQSLQSHNAALQSEIHLLRQSQTAPEPQEDKNITDFKTYFGSYDPQTNTLPITVSIVPKTYSESTKAQICIKGKENSQTVPVTIQDGAYVATIPVVVEQDMAVYLYLATEDETQNLLVTPLYDLQERFTLKILHTIKNNNKIGTKKPALDMVLESEISWPWEQSNGKPNLLPKKGTVEIIYQGKVLETLQITALSDVFLENSQTDNPADDSAKAYSTGATFYTYIKTQLPPLAENEEIVFKITITDSLGYEHIEIISKKI